MHFVVPIPPAAFISDFWENIIGWSVIALVIGGWIASIPLRLKKKRKELQKEAAAMGFAFQAKGDALRAGLSNNFRLIQSLGRGGVSDVLRGSGPIGPVVLFECAAINGGGRSTSAVASTVAAFQFPKAVFPDFYLGPNNLAYKLGQRLGSLKSIKFETHPQFADRFLLQGPNEEAIRQLFRPAVLDGLQILPTTPKPDWTVEGSGSWLLVYRVGKQPKPADLRAFRDAAAAVATNIVSVSSAMRS